MREADLTGRAVCRRRCCATSTCPVPGPARPTSPAATCVGSDLSSFELDTTTLARAIVTAEQAVVLATKLGSTCAPSRPAAPNLGRTETWLSPVCPPLGARTSPTANLSVTSPQHPVLSVEDMKERVLKQSRVGTVLSARVRSCTSCGDGQIHSLVRSGVRRWLRWGPPAYCLDQFAMCNACRHAPAARRLVRRAYRARDPAPGRGPAGIRSRRIAVAGGMKPYQASRFRLSCRELLQGRAAPKRRPVVAITASDTTTDQHHR